MRIVSVGATSAIAQGVVKEWLKPATEVVLVGRNKEELAKVKSDLEARGATATVLIADLKTAADVEKLAVEVFKKPVDKAVIATGIMPSQDNMNKDLDSAERMLQINGTLTAILAHTFAQAGAVQRGLDLLVIGSVAGDRGRKSNYLYGASKAMVEAAVAGLQHRYAGTAVRLTLGKPGPTKSAMTASLPGYQGMADSDEVGRLLAQATDKGEATCYAPGKWRLIMAIVRNLPRALFHKTNL